MRLSPGALKTGALIIRNLMEEKSITEERKSDTLRDTSTGAPKGCIQAFPVQEIQLLLSTKS